nr:unnamed protein product [Digitaria exilis]
MASKLTGILVSMAKKEVEMLLGVPGEITKLETTLGDLSSILADAERKRIRDSTTQRWVRVLKDVMYDADDVLDLCQIMEGGEDPTAPTSAPKATSMCWDIPKMLFCFRNPIVAHDIGRKIQAVNQQLEDLAKRSSRFGFITQAINSSDSISRASYFSSSKTGSGIVKSDVVGEKIEANTKRLVDILVKKVDGAPVGLIGNDLIVDVAITGAGGIGKTTLARMIFSDSRVEEKFEDKIWLSVNQDVNEISLLQSLLASFGAKHEGFAGDRGLLERALKDTVHQKKFLLVMDDVWSEKVWNELLSVPLSYGASGSCVLVTTRNDGVARGMKAQHLHRVDKLEMEDAWILLKSQVIDLFGCKNVSKLPSSIMKLRKLRSLILTGTTITSIPRAFRKLEDLVHLLGFPTHSDDSSGSCWCSLEELGPLSKLKVLEICNVEKAPSGSMASKAMLSSKHHLRDLDLIFTSRLGENGVVEDDISEEEHEAIEDVLANLCPPTCTEELDIIGYFGRGLPQWMKTMSGFRGLRRLLLKDYACCTQLPNALGQLPHLDFFWIKRAPSVRFIGHQLILPSLGTEADSNGEAPVLTGTRNRRMQSHSRVAFPKLVSLGFEGMLGWTEWEWEQNVPAMPVLEELDIHNCKLQRLPAGLEHHARRLRKLNLRNVQSLVSVENFPSLVELSSHDNARLERIRNNPSLQWIGISRCPAIKELDGSPSLRSLEWWDLDAEALPEYLLEANLKKLRVDCSQNLLRLIVLQDESSESEWSKIQHVQQLKAYGHKTEEEVEVADESHSQEDERAEWWYIHYTKEPYSFDAYLGESTGDFIFYLVPTLFL